MFSGIIETLGTVRKKTTTHLVVKTKIKRPRLGSSIAVNGCCLTLVERNEDECGFDVGPETWERTNLGGLKAGQAVNVETSLRLGDEIGGHFVTGHVDAAAKILSLADWGEGFKRLRVELPRALRGLIAEKGSVAVDGISLTVASVKKDHLEIMIVPHTLKSTNLGRRRAGERVNLEADPLARYARAAASALRGRP